MNLLVFTKIIIKIKTESNMQIYEYRKNRVFHKDSRKYLFAIFEHLDQKI